MLNITNPQRKANQDHNEISPHNCQNGYKRTQRTNGSETVNWCSHCRKQYGDTSEQVKMELPYDPAIPHLGKYPKKKKVQKDTYTPILLAALLQRDTCMPIFIVVVFLSVKIWK